MLARAKLATARNGLDMDPEDFLTLWQAVHGDSPKQARTEELQPQADGWSKQLEDALRGSASPQMAKSIAATERLWIRIEDEFGMLTSEEVTTQFGLPAEESASALIDQGVIVGVLRRGKLRFPGFQFDFETKQVWPVIKTLIRIAAEHNYDMVDLTLLMVSPSTYFEGGSRPVDHLDDPDLPDKIRNKISVEW